MFAQTLYTGTREENYDRLIQQLEALISTEEDMIANKKPLGIGSGVR